MSQAGRHYLFDNTASTPSCVSYSTESYLKGLVLSCCTYLETGTTGHLNSTNLRSTSALQKYLHVVAMSANITEEDLYDNALPNHNGTTTTTTTTITRTTCTTDIPEDQAVAPIYRSNFIPTSFLIKYKDTAAAFRTADINHSADDHICVDTLNYDEFRQNIETRLGIALKGKIVRAYLHDVGDSRDQRTLVSVRSAQQWHAVLDMLDAAGERRCDFLVEDQGFMRWDELMGLIVLLICFAFWKLCGKKARA